MSSLAVSEIGGTLSSNNVVSIASNSVIDNLGSPIQTYYCRTDKLLSYSTTPSGMGNPMRDLQLTIKPRKANSLIVLEWMINMESYENSVFVIWQNESILNSGKGNFYDGIVSSTYDRNQDSTPANIFLQFIVPAYNKNVRSYLPAVRSSYSGSSHTITVNRTISSTGQDAYETMISTGTVMEIAQ